MSRLADARKASAAIGRRPARPPRAEARKTTIGR
jgi:hypothetical protein